MKNILLVLVILPTLIFLAPAQNTSSSTTSTATPPSATSTTPASPLASLTNEQRTTVSNAVNAAVLAYNQGKYDDSLAQLDIADKIAPKTPDLINLRGSVLMKQQKWDKAAEQFNAVLAINPKFFAAKFNLGEIPYMQKKYADARAIFTKALADDPKSELLQYKIFLTYLMENNLDQAQEWMKKFDPFGDTPAYYFVQAAWAYSKKNDKEAESYIASSIGIFPAPANNIFAEPLIQAGWLKRSKPNDTP